MKKIKGEINIQLTQETLMFLIAGASGMVGLRWCSVTNTWVNNPRLTENTHIEIENLRV